MEERVVPKLIEGESAWGCHAVRRRLGRQLFVAVHVHGMRRLAEWQCGKWGGVYVVRQGYIALVRRDSFFFHDPLA